MVANLAEDGGSVLFDAGAAQGDSEPSKPSKQRPPGTTVSGDNHHCTNREYDVKNNVQEVSFRSIMRKSHEMLVLNSINIIISMSRATLFVGFLLVAISIITKTTLGISRFNDNAFSRQALLLTALYISSPFIVDLFRLFVNKDNRRASYFKRLASPSSLLVSVIAGVGILANYSPTYYINKFYITHSSFLAVAILSKLLIVGLISIYWVYLPQAALKHPFNKGHSKGARLIAFIILIVAGYSLNYLWVICGHYLQTISMNNFAVVVFVGTVLILLYLCTCTIYACLFSSLYVALADLRKNVMGNATNSYS